MSDIHELRCSQPHPANAVSPGFETIINKQSKTPSALAMNGANCDLSGAGS